MLILYRDGAERRSVGQFHGSITIRDIRAALDAIKRYVFVLRLQHYRTEQFAGIQAVFVDVEFIIQPRGTELCPGCREVNWTIDVFQLGCAKEIALQR